MLQLRSKVRRRRQGCTYRGPSQSRAAPSLPMIQRLGSTKTASYSPINLLSAGLPILRKVRPTGFERLVTARPTAHTERSTLHERLTPDTEYVRVHHAFSHSRSLTAMIQMALEDQPAANYTLHGCVAGLALYAT